MTIKNRVADLEKRQGEGQHDYVIQRQIIFGDAEAEPFPDLPPGDGRPTIRILRRVTTSRPDNMDEEEHEVWPPRRGR